MNMITLDSELDFLTWRKGSGETVEIYDIAIGTKRGIGRGTELVNRLLTMIPTNIKLVWAITRYDNTRARRFYEKLGFRIVGELRQFYQEVADNKYVIDALMYGLDVRKVVV